MSRRSSIDLGAICKSARRLARHPWIFSKLAKLQAEKTAFGIFNPRAADGLAGRIHQLSIRITDICNLRCHTCGQWGDNGFLRGQELGRLKRQEVSPGRYRELLNDLTAHGHQPNVYLWGGEPMLYPGALEVIEHATGLGLPCSVASNGHRVAPAAERLAAAPLFLMQLSIDGHDRATHNRARPAAGRGGDAFGDIEAALEALHAARQRHGHGLPLIASLTVISRANLEHLADIYRAFSSRVDLMVFYLGWWITPERAEAHQADFARRFGFAPRLHRGWLGRWQPGSMEVLADQVARLKELSRPFKATPVTFIPGLTEPRDLARYYGDHAARFGFDQCISIFQVAELDSNGDLSPCRDYHDYVVGNVQDQTISQLWNSAGFRRFRRSLHNEGLMPVCSRCCGLMGY